MLGNKFDNQGYPYICPRQALLQNLHINDQLVINCM